MAYIALTERPTPPAEVVEKLHQIDPHLNLKFVEYPTGEAGNAVRWWALVWEWPKDDPRHVMVMRNEMPPDGVFDVLGHVPLDCDVYSAFNYVKEHLMKNRDDPRHSKLVERVGEYNRKRKDEIKAEVAERAAEVIEANIKPIMSSLGKSQPKVFQKGK